MQGGFFSLRSFFVVSSGVTGFPYRPSSYGCFGSFVGALDGSYHLFGGYSIEAAFCSGRGTNQQVCGNAKPGLHAPNHVQRKASFTR